ncbi:DUF7538 family protein [Halosimplex amylolyticum]|uniref:DUF7538 family protein n=1 Tax=Halosimplex amylolyticum TaxID=3396616 RepID=UPI003F57B947
MSEGPGSGAGSSESLGGLAEREGWRVEGPAARVHYEGEGDRYSVEYYAPSDCVIYWKVPPEGDGETAVPVGRDTVPTPLRERIRLDLDAAGIDPGVERRNL